jgi:hypothetical protein
MSYLPILKFVHEHSPAPRPLATYVAGITCVIAGFRGLPWWTVVPLAFGLVVAEHLRLIYEGRIRLTDPRGLALFFTCGPFAAIFFGMGRLALYFSA